METFLILNGTEIDASVDDQKHLILDVAAGRIGLSHLVDRLRQHIKDPRVIVAVQGSRSAAGGRVKGATAPLNCRVGITVCRPATRFIGDRPRGRAEPHGDWSV